MNELNYGSREAGQRLLDAGISVVITLLLCIWRKP